MAARWAKETLGERWALLIQRAWSGRQNPGLMAQLEDMNVTLDFVRYALEYSQHFGITADEPT